MKIKPIRTEEEYNEAIAEIERIMSSDFELGTPEGDKLEVLSILVDVYEKEHYSMPLPDPIEAIKYFMETRGLDRKDLEPYIGTRARVSEVLNRKRPLTLNMIRNLVDKLGIPAEILIQPYDLGENTIVIFDDVEIYFSSLIKVMTGITGNNNLTPMPDYSIPQDWKDSSKTYNDEKVIIQ